MRPVDHHLVGVGEPPVGREGRAGIADRDAVSEERPDPGHGGGEIDGTEHQHPRGRRETGHEDRQSLAAPLPFGPVGQGCGPAGGQQSAGIIAHRVVQPGAAQRPGRIRRPDHQVPADLFRVAGDDGGERDRLAGGDGRCEGSEIGKIPAGDRFDEDIDDPAAGQPDGECIVVGDAVALQERRVAGAHGGREVVDRTLDATAGHRADRGPVRADEHRRTGWTRGRSEGADHRADADDVAGLPPPQQVGQHFPHG